MKRQDFFKKYQINENVLRETGLVWNELIEIQNDFEKTRDKLSIDANYVADRLRSFDCIHTVKTRIKDPEHLIEKIIRSKIEKPRLSINIDNYSCIVNDLVGVRTLHLFKEDWEAIHRFIVNTWELKQNPVANISAQDSERLVEKYQENGCEIIEHPHGYRSVHYVILFERSKSQKIPVEIQVRTILEEAWSEIDHLVRYPYKDGHGVYSPYLSILNQLIAQADEISSFIHLLKSDDNHQKIKNKATREQDEKVIADIYEQLDKFRIEKNQKKAFEDQIRLLEERIATAGSLSERRHSDKTYDMYAPHLSKTKTRN
jgi:putative GTP pyrophosphokinase